MGPEHHSVLCVCMCVSLCVLHTWNWKYRKRRTSFVTEKPFSLMHHKTFDVESFNVTLQIFFLKHLQHQLELKVQLAGGSGQKACSLFPVCVHQTIQTHLIWYTSEEQGMKGLSAGTKRLFCMKPAFVLFSENTNYDCKEDRRPSATSCCDYKDRNTVMVVITKPFEQFEISDSERSVVITKRAFFLHTRTRRKHRI